MRILPLVCLGAFLPLSAQAVFQQAQPLDGPLCSRVTTQIDSSGKSGRRSAGASQEVASQPLKPLEKATSLYPAGGRKSVQAFAAVGDTGKSTTLAQLQGKIVLVAFWSAKCEPSSRLLTELGDLYGKREKFGFDILAVNFDENRVADNVEGGWRAIQRFRQRAKAFFDQTRLPLYVPGVGAQGPSVLIEDVEAVPVLFVIDREGKLASTSIGYEPNAAAKLLSRVLREQPQPAQP